MKISGIAASECLDSSGESISIEGLDISALTPHEGVPGGALNYEHRGADSPGASGSDIVGVVTFAKKIFTEKDCESDDERKFWDMVECPYLYLQGELFDQENHAGALALAANFRYHARRGIPMLLRLSIEGSTLARDPHNKNVITQCIARACAITAKPCNRSAVTGVLEDPMDGDINPAPRESLLRFEDPLRERLSSYEFEFTPEQTPEEALKSSLENLREISVLSKAISAGSYNVAPGALSGGSALQVEDTGYKKIKPQILAAIRDWDRRQPFKTFLKSRLPDVAEGFLDHFAGIVDDLEAKKSEQLESDLRQAFSPLSKKDKTEEAAAPEEKASRAEVTSEPLTSGGKRLRPIPSLGKSAKFDERKGILYTPRGSFPMYIPSRDKDPSARESFHNILNDPKVNAFHGYAMDNWAKLHELLQQKKMPPSIIQHATLFSQLSPQTPVPMQEYMYGHLVDAMRETGVDATHPDFEAVVKPNWIARDTGKEWPKHSRGHYEAHENQLRLKNATKGGYFQGSKWIPSQNAIRQPGDIASFQMATNKFKLMNRYKDIHDQLVATVNKHGTDIRSAAADLMQQKSSGQGVPGLAPKTTRYTLGMLGGGNVIVPDTHFVRNIFGLDKGKDAGSINYLKNLLWDEKHGPLLEAMDRHYGQHHDAVHHMREHPKYKHLFEGDQKEQAIFPAFWKHWVSITPHEKARGMTAGGFNEVTDHRPFWEAVEPMIPHMVKAEDETPLALRTAKLHADWVQKYGEMPAMMMYYAYLVPQLLHAHHHHKVEKMETLTGRLIKAAGAEPQVDKPAVHNFRGQDVTPGEIEVISGPHRGHKMPFVGVDATHFYVQRLDRDLQKLPRNLERKQFQVNSHPTPAASSLIDADKHGIGYLNTRPEQRALIQGIDVAGAKPQSGFSLAKHFAQRNSIPMGWTKNTAGQSVFIKPDTSQFSAMSGPQRDIGYKRLADEFFGMGQHVPEHAAFVDPSTGTHYTAVEGIPEGRHVTGEKSEMRPHLMNAFREGTTDKAALMDIVLGNSDRHEHNYMMTEAEPNLRLIDHSNAFRYAEAPDSSGWDRYISATGHPVFNGPLHPAAQAWLHGLDANKLADQLLSTGVPKEDVKKAVTRLTRAQQELSNNPNMSRSDFQTSFQWGPPLKNNSANVSDLDRALQADVSPARGKP